MSEKENIVNSEDRSDNEKKKKDVELEFDIEIVDYNVTMLEKAVDNILKDTPKKQGEKFISESGVIMEANPQTGRILDTELDSMEDYKNSSKFDFDMVVIGRIIKITNLSYRTHIEPNGQMNINKAINKFNSLNKIF